MPVPFSDSARRGVGLALASLHLAAVCWVAAHGVRLFAGPLHLDPLRDALNAVVVAVSFAARGRGAAALMLGAAGLVLDGVAGATLLGLAGMLAGGMTGAPAGYRAGCLAGGLVLLVTGAGGSAVVSCLTGLVLLAAFADVPVLGLALLATHVTPDPAAGWLLVAAGLAGCWPIGAERRTLVPRSVVLPLFWLAALLGARRADLAETALAAAEALLLSMVLLPAPGVAEGRAGILLRSVLPGAAGFLPLWLGLHAFFGLAAAETGWIVPALTLGGAIGWIAVLDLRARWRRLGEAGQDRVEDYVLPGLAAVAPGLVFMIVAPGLAAMCGAGESWSGSLFAPVPGGDGGRWLPWLAALLLASLVLAAGPGGRMARDPFEEPGARPGAAVWTYGWRRRAVLFRRGGRRWGETLAKAADMKNGLELALKAPLSPAFWLALVAFGLAVLGAAA
ncbi:hypothetical protein [Acidomonas methanolica]|uniref:hypothetical protein n=1 Tax=Acidomonas methanolica TaxID=437 RepID=UPI00211A0EEE|nr:hypothetical protein [Acidomonas methanolica]MCQ9156074.1 hypothetical protein [Acidomonas methanolica]